MADALVFDDVYHSYGKIPSLYSVSFSVSPGEVVCLLGPSGCGKTTTLRIAAGLEPLTSGQVLMEGKVVTGRGCFLPPEKRKAGLVFQDYALFPHLNVHDNVAFGLSRHEKKSLFRKTDNHSVIADVLAQVGMDHYRKSWPHELSGGQKQRVALARALAISPRIVLLDEPFSGLDARLRDRVRDNTLHALKKSGAAVLMVTHDAEEAMYMADRIIVMQNGKIVQSGSPKDLYSNPASSFVAAFFGDVNRLVAPVQDGKIQTILGTFHANGAREGDHVELVVRPEAIGLEKANSDSEGAGYARVMASRMLGRSSLVHLCACRTTGEEIHLHARIPGDYQPEEQSVQRMHIDDSRAFVFPLTKEQEQRKSREFS